jgi:uncharacterized membrane protein
MPSRQPATAGTRVVVAFLTGVAIGLVAGLFAPWQESVMLGWVAASTVFLTWIWSTIGSMDADRTRRLAVREDDSRTAADFMLLAASVVSLIGVGLALVKGAQEKGHIEALLISTGVATVLVSWAAVHTVFTLRYAHLFYGGTPGGIDFNEDDPPRYTDFAYVAFTIGMTFQVSDTSLTAKSVRAVALRQALLSYLFGAVIVAMTINVVAGLLK